MIYLCYADGDLPADAVGPWDDLFVLRPGLVLVDSESSRSRVYHAIKHQLPSGTALLVAALDEPPKFKGMAAGALTWVRSRS